MSEDKRESVVLDPEKAKALREQWTKSMERLSETSMPPAFRDFLLAIENLKNDEEALETLKEEIVNHYGE